MSIIQCFLAIGESRQRFGSCGCNRAFELCQLIRCERRPDGRCGGHAEAANWISVVSARVPGSESGSEMEPGTVVKYLDLCRARHQSL